jgi:gamma-glutamyl hydrolase
MIIMANDPNVLVDGYNNSHQNTNQRFTQAAQSSRLWANLPDWMSNAIQTEPVLLFNHEWGIEPKTYWATPALYNNMNLLSTAWDVNGRELVCTVEHKIYPFYGVAFHPEKSIYEWLPAANASHTIESVQIIQFLGNFFNRESRKNLNTFSDPKEEYNSLAYSYTPVRFKDSQSFEQIYFLENCNITNCSLSAEPKGFNMTLARMIIA